MTAQLEAARPLGEFVVTGNVYVVDDDPDARDSVCALVQSHGLRANAFCSAEQFLQFVHALRPGCLVCDLRLPGIDGLQLLDRLSGLGLKFPVIVVTGYADIRTAVRAIQAGARDFVQKPFEPESIMFAVRRALRELDDDRGNFAGFAIKCVAGLSARERELLQRLMQGKPNKVIAYELKISVRTVEYHRSRLMGKMQADSLSDLVRVGLAAGVSIEPDDTVCKPVTFRRIS